MSLSTSKQLYEAILLLREEEKKAQKELAKRIKKRGAKKEVEVFEEEDEDEEDLFGGDEEGGDEEGGDEEGGGEDPAGEEGGEGEPGEEGGEEEKKDGKLAGADELNDTPQELPQVLRGNDFVDKINKIRAGASLKDKDVQTRIIGYVKSLSSDERDDLWVNLDSLARIILGGVDPAQVLTPSLVTGPSRKKPSQPQQATKKKGAGEEKPREEKYSDAPIVAPIKAVSEGVKKQMTEVPFVLRSNKTVPFGHSSHVRDLERLLSDLMRFRSCQERGSESWMSIGLAIRSVKSQLSHARRKSAGVRDTIDKVDIGVMPQLVEKD